MLRPVFRVLPVGWIGASVNSTVNTDSRRLAGAATAAQHRIHRVHFGQFLEKRDQVVQFRVGDVVKPRFDGYL